MALLTNINGKFSVSDAGAVTFNNAFTFPTADGTANYVLKTNGSGQLSWSPDNNNGDITGSGTANTVTKFTGAKTIGDGPITFSSNDSTFAGNITANTGSKITSSSTDTTFSIETTSGTTIFPILDFVSSHSSAGARIRVSGTDVISLDKSQNATFAGTVQTTQITATNGLNYLKRNTDASLQLRSENTRSGLFITKPATDTVMGSALVLADESYRLGTANYYHMYMLQNGNTYFTQNVGIGTTSPGDLLTLAGNTNSYSTAPVIRFDSTSTQSANIRNWAVGPADSSYGNFHIFKSAATGGDPITGAGATTFTIDYTGNVGIGTTNPSARMHVVNNSTSVDTAIFESSANSSHDCIVAIKSPRDSYLIFQPANTSKWAMIADYPSTGDFDIYNYPNNFDSMTFKDNKNIITNMSGGNFGIGVTSPDTKLHVGGTIKLGGYSYIGEDLSDQDSLTIASDHTEAIHFAHFTPATGTYSTNMIIDNSGNVGIGTTSFASTANLQLKLGNMGSGIVGEIFDAVSNADNSRIIVCGGGTGTPQFSMRHYSAGYGIDMWLNTSSPWDTYIDNRNGASGFIFRNNCNSNGGEVTLMDLDGNSGNGTLTVKGDVVAYGSPSDIRLKENIKPIESALDKVSKLQGVTFDWKKSDSTLNIKEDIGFIAQDVQKVIPELVRENGDGMLSMRHQGIAPILLEAIKELKAEIEELKKYKCDCKK